MNANLQDTYLYMYKLCEKLIQVKEGVKHLKPPWISRYEAIYCMYRNVFTLEVPNIGNYQMNSQASQHSFEHIQEIYLIFLVLYLNTVQYD